MNEPIRFWAVVIGITLVGGSANVLNQFYDRDIDQIMERTAKKRPLPQGKMSPRAALIFGLTTGALGLFALWYWGTLLAAALGAATIFYYVVIYTMWLKRRTPYNIVIGGAAGAAAPLIGWAAATSDVSLLAFWLFLIIFMWTPPHFWALALVVKDEYAKAAVPMLPVAAGVKRTRIEIVIYTLLMLPISLFPEITKSAGTWYTVIAIVLAIGFLYFTFNMAKKKDDRSAWGLFGYSIVYLLLLFLVMCVGALVNTPQAQAAEPVPRELQNIGVDEHLENRIDLGLAFKDEEGKDVELKQYFKQGKPVALFLVYYGCPSLCGFFLNGATDGMKKIAWTPGQEFEIVTISIDPTEKPELAQAKKKSLLKVYAGNDQKRLELAQTGWHFLTGKQENISKITEQVGFKYRYDEETKQYAHSPVMTILTPEGTISRYLYGIEFKGFDLKLALNEASQGHIGNIIDRLVLFCYHYDPKNRQYALYAMNAMRVGGAGTVLILGAGLLVGLKRGSGKSRTSKKNSGRQA